MEELAKAIQLAMRAHAGQTDKGGRPYIAHPLRMVAEAIDDYVDPDIAIVAALHDVVEDTDLGLHHLRIAGFSPKVVDAVDALTKRRGETYRQSLHRAKANAIARVVKLLDNRDNSKAERLDRIDDEETRNRLAAKYEEARAFLIA